jgi:hypothetical protein
MTSIFRLPERTGVDGSHAVQRHSPSRWVRGALGLSLLAMTVAACSSGEDAAGADPLPGPSTTTASSVTGNSGSLAPSSTAATDLIRMPLTGEVLGSVTAIPDRPALAVKFDNHPRARPQAGLNEADIIFEENVENLTRFAAVFHSTDAEMIGPIRSGRSQDIAILSAFDRPLFAWSGGNDGVRRLVRNSDLVDLDAGRTSGYYRRTGRSAPHNLYSSTEALWVHAPEGAQAPPQVFEYLGPEGVVDGSAAQVLRVSMDGLQIRWDYDAEARVYLRFQNDQAHQTESSGQVRADTVIVMAVDYRPSAADPNSPEAQLTGSGPVVVMSGGLVRTGTWMRDAPSEPYRFLLENGEPLLLSPGRTFVHLARDREGFAIWE